MTSGMIGCISIALVVLLVVAQVPIGFALLGVGVLGFAFQLGITPALTVLASESVANLSSVDLATIPLFILMGAFATKAGLSSDLFRAVAALLGHRRGGLAYATIGGAAMFGVVCGSSLATVATFGKASLPEMVKRGYSPSYAAGTVAAGGTLKSLIPPSLPMIFYCIVSKTFILDLFLAAVIPALLSVCLNILAVFITVKFFPRLAPTSPRLTLVERWVEVRPALPLVILVVAIFGGFYSGVFTVNEAAAVSVSSVLLYSLLSRRLGWSQIVQAMWESAGTTAMIYVLVIGAFVFSNFLGLLQVPEAIIQTVGSLEMRPIAIIGLMLLCYLILGTILDETTAMLVTLPFALPLVVSMGYDPVWWGVINVVIIELGMILPPVGIAVFMLRNLRPDLSITQITIGVSPYIAANFVLLAILVLFPWFSLVLVR